MKSIDLERIILEYSLDSTELATLLFPTNGFPKPALKRVLKGDALLDTEQVSKLAKFIGVTIGELFGETNWLHTGTENNFHYFHLGEYSAQLNTATWLTTIFHKESLFHECIIHSGSIAMNNYFDLLNQKISEING